MQTSHDNSIAASLAAFTLLLLAGCGTSSPMDATVPGITTTPAPAGGEVAGSDPAADEPPAAYARPRSRVRSGGVLDLVFDDLKFEIEPDGDFKREMLTEEIESFHDKPIILRGFILDASIFQQKGIKQFLLIRDNQECCFGPGAKIYHNVWVDMDEGKTANFKFRPVTVRGKFQIRPWFNESDGKCYSVYHIQASSVK